MAGVHQLCASERCQFKWKLVVVDASGDAKGYDQGAVCGDDCPCSDHCCAYYDVGAFDDCAKRR
jgi:hypothetical protein